MPVLNRQKNDFSDKKIEMAEKVARLQDLKREKKMILLKEKNGKIKK